VVSGSRGVTAETAPQSIRIDEAAQGVLKIGGRFGSMTRGEIKAPYCFVKAQATLVVKPFRT